MSVVRQNEKKGKQCPVCLDLLDADDCNFYPCFCGYQICRFCWHKIRIDDNDGLCPACFKVYPEIPAAYTPASQEQMAKSKAEKKRKAQQKKEKAAKLIESQKNLANVRVVQKNLALFMGLPIRLANPEVLKRRDHFGQFGKIQKIVTHQSTKYVRSKGPCVNAYVTYIKSGEALRAIDRLNNSIIDGQIIKARLGTSRYCRNFIKKILCQNPNCMYLHAFGEPEACCTPDEMLAGKPQEYEKKLHETFFHRTNSKNKIAKSSNWCEKASSTQNKGSCPQFNLQEDNTINIKERKNSPGKIKNR